jgi:HD-GYP domain-containing protein (c-di-GMP phosphodiesterase class II)
MADETFTPIRVATLRGDFKIPFDVYVRVAGKHILYCRQGSSFEGVRLERLKAKKLKKMYVRAEDEIPYKQYLEQSIDAAYSNSDRPFDVRAEVIQGFQQAKAEEYMENPLDKTTYDHIKSSAQRFTEFVTINPDAVRAILKIPNTDCSVTHHSVSVAALSLALVLETKLREGHPLHLLTLGCLVHDVEHYLGDYPVNKPPDQLTPEEKARYQEHPLKGGHRLQGVAFLDQLVVNVITQHEEHMDGSGFPKGLYEKDIDPLVIVAGTANAYDRIVSFEQTAPKDAMKSMLIDKIGMYPLLHLQNLQSILKRHKII